MTLGWAVTPGLDPRYWITSNPVPGEHSVDDLVVCPASKIANHCAIIAQSGSGKSFFLGRFVEEILLKTKSRCVVLDPNGDFLRAKDVELPGPWNNPSYDASQRRGLLPDEPTRVAFKTQWDNVTKRIRSALKMTDSDSLSLSWTSLSAELLTADVDPFLRDEVYLCHEFVSAVETLLPGRLDDENAQANVLEEAEALFKRASVLDDKDLRKWVCSEYKTESLIDQLLEDNAVSVAVKKDRPKPTTTSPPDDSKNTRTFRFEVQLETKKKLSKKAMKAFLNRVTKETNIILRRLHSERVSRAIDTVCQVPAYISERIFRFYFGRARAYQSSGIFEVLARASKKEGEGIVNLEVIDLPSIVDVGARRLAVSSLLATEVERARTAWNSIVRERRTRDVRRPTFIVVDEAHNLIPERPQSKAEIALREQFRMIAAEGRKFGLFLIVVSQRPDKLDRLILSECENRAVMRLGSLSVLDLTRNLLGLEDIPNKRLQKCLEFGIGRAMLIGPWAGSEPQILYSAARRTVEGGRNLPVEYWAAPWPGIRTKRAKSSANKDGKPKRKQARKRAAKSERTSKSASDRKKRKAAVKRSSPSRKRKT